MKYPVRFGISACLRYSLLVVVASTVAASQQNTVYPAPPPPEGYGGSIGGNHPRCTEKNAASDCRPIPRVVSSPPATYSVEARKAKIEGSCTLTLVVDENGNPTNLRVIRSLGMGLDEKAIEAVKSWKFEPAFGKDGKPVASKIAVEVDFRL